MQISLWTAQMFPVEETQIYINSVMAPLLHSSYDKWRIAYVNLKST